MLYLEIEDIFSWALSWKYLSCVLYINTQSFLRKIVYIPMPKPSLQWNEDENEDRNKKEDEDEKLKLNE